MKLYKRTLYGLSLMLLTTAPIIAQQVRIEIPVNNIINGTEFNISKVVMNTAGNDKWESPLLDPKIWSIENSFKHTSSGVTLPNSILQWQLESIGGSIPLFKGGDVLPGFQQFTTSPQAWYLPKNPSGGFNAGNVVFKFKISSQAFLNNSLAPGEYALEVAHNYGSSDGGIQFTPISFTVILVIPSTNPIKWVTNTPTKYHEISSLNQYRAGGTRTFDAIGPSEISNTVDFNIWAKTATSSIQFTSSKGVVATRPVSLLKLGSIHPKIITASLSANWKNYTLNNPFLVVAGNKHNFTFQLSISEADFKNHFFEAGTYKFQLNLDAKSTDNNVSAIQNTDVTFKVLPLSEITIPTSGNEVNFEFNTTSHYLNGQTKIIPNQIKYSNNETYELYVKSDAAFFKRSGIQSDVPSSILQVGVEGRSETVTLTPTSQKIITNGTHVLDKDLNMKYTIPENAAQTLIAKEKSTYSINVIYSFTAL